MKDHKALILYHSTGAGKTLTSLYAIYPFPNDILIIGPKSSKKAFYDNMQKANMSTQKVTFHTYTKLKLLLEQDLEIFRNKNVIIDEAHNLRNETVNNMAIISALDFANKIILLTATPIINHLSDFAVLVNICKGGDVLPTDKDLFNALYYNMENNGIANADILKDKMKDCVSYYKNMDTDDYPRSETKYIECEMDDHQLVEYANYVKKFVYSNPSEEDIYGVDFHTLKGRKKNNFLTATRQLSNIAPGQSSSPKIERIFEMIKSGPFPIVCYSNFLKYGVYLIALMLERAGISYKTITGDTSSDNIVNIVNAYNSGKYKVLLISAAGSESLDLKKTRAIHILEPHWNESRIIQVIGRAIRFKSHEGLPLEERSVMVYRWISIFPKHIVNQTADQYLAELSLEKESIASQFVGLIKEVSIERHMIGGYKRRYETYRDRYMVQRKGMLQGKVIM